MLGDALFALWCEFGDVAFGCVSKAELFDLQNTWEPQCFDRDEFEFGDAIQRQIDSDPEDLWTPPSWDGLGDDDIPF